MDARIESSARGSIDLSRDQPFGEDLALEWELQSGSGVLDKLPYELFAVTIMLHRRLLMINIMDEHQHR